MNSVSSVCRTSVASLVVLVAGCSSPTSPGVCDRPISVTVTPGTSPTFSWPADCAINTLAVYPPSTGPNPPQPVWSITAPAGSSFAGSSVTYTSVPSNATADVPATPLKAGTHYEVVVGFWKTINEVTNGTATVFVP